MFIETEQQKIRKRPGYILKLDLVSATHTIFFYILF